MRVLIVIDGADRMQVCVLSPAIVSRVWCSVMPSHHKVVEFAGNGSLCVWKLSVCAGDRS